MSRITEKGNSSEVTATGENKDHILAIGQQRIHVNAVTAKIIDDIEFLRDRIDKIKQLKAPNSTILATYQEMLANRESVLNWLKQHEAPNADREFQSKVS